MFEQKDAKGAKAKGSKGREFGSRSMGIDQHPNFRLLGWKKRKERPGLDPLGTPIEEI
jgi:hypothetical protein